MKNGRVTGPYVAEKLLETLPKMKNFKALFNNWFNIKEKRVRSQKERTGESRVLNR